MTKKIKEMFLMLQKIFIRKLVINVFKSELLQLKSTTRTGLKILTPKQLLQRLPIALAQVKAGNNSENLLNEIRQIIYSLYQSK